MSVKLKDLPYKRPDLAAIKAQINQKALELESCLKVEEQIQLILAVEQLYNIVDNSFYLPRRPFPRNGLYQL